MITELLEDLDTRVSTELKTAITIEDVESVPDISDLYLEKRTWKRIKNVVVVAADLKGSTQLNFDRYANTGASIYEALCSNVVRCYDKFDPAFLDIQGDGFFALFDDEMRYERALCAAITIKSFSEQVFVPQVKKKFPELVSETGLKVGMAAGILVAKNVGIRGTKEPVWAGKPVNWAHKAAQSATAHELVVTSGVYKHFENNDFVTHSCDCDTPGPLWSDHDVKTLPETDVSCRRLGSQWCTTCGDDYCEAILNGEKDRAAVSAVR